MKEISFQNFGLVEKSEIPVIVMMSASWCSPCKSMYPIMEEIAKDFDGKVEVLKCNVDDNHQLAEKFGIRNIPTMLYFKNGRMVDKQVGAGMKSVFTNKIQSLLS